MLDPIEFQSEVVSNADELAASADAKLRKLRVQVSSLLRMANLKDSASFSQHRRSYLEGRIAAYGQVIREADELLSNPPSAEAERGPSEVEQLREQLRQRGLALDRFTRKAESEIAALTERAEWAEECAKMAESELRVEKRSRKAMASNYREAVAERDRAESRLQTAVGGSAWFETIRAECQANANAQLRELRRWLDQCNPPIGDASFCRGHKQLMAVVAERIDRLLSNPPSAKRDEANPRGGVGSVDPDDEILRDWLDSHNPDDAMSTTSRQDLNALAILCRRALREGGR